MPRDYDQTAAALIRGAEKAVAVAVAPLLKRIEDLEARQPEKGDCGERGEAGSHGEPGRDGIGLAGAVIDRSGSLIITLTNGDTRDLGSVIGPVGDRGAKGDRGEIGEKGERGEIGLKGDKGDKGEAGPQGDAGPAGTDGSAGERGEKGDKGDSGEPGERGADGQDAYHGEARGLYDPEASYQALDVASFNGSEWRAKHDDPGPLPGDGWMLSAQRGKRGEQGQKGDRGSDGKSGKDGAQPIEVHFKPDEMKLIMVLDDGNFLEADFEPIMRAMRAEEA